MSEIEFLTFQIDSVDQRYFIPAVIMGRYVFLLLIVWSTESKEKRAAV